MITWLENTDPTFSQRLGEFISKKRTQAPSVFQDVAEILDSVRLEGDAALFALTARFDHFELTAETIQITRSQIASAYAACDSGLLEALTIAIERIRTYHQKQYPENVSFQDALGVALGYRWTPIESVGLYVPGGTAAYPSSVLMNAIPAQVAGVSRMAMVVPTPHGNVNPAVLAAAHLLGIDEIYRIGGAQAIAALTYGTDSVKPVSKIVGPGNAYVAAAKAQVFGTVGIDMIAGPSEVVILADAQNDPDWIAADLLAQAEHDPWAQAILMTDSASFAHHVLAALEDLVRTLPRKDIALHSLKYNGALVVVSSLEDAVEWINQIAPEHLEIATQDPEKWSEKIRHAGAIFLGSATPEAIGDYIAGSNHVLPTSRSARFSSGLGVLDFMKRTSLLKCSPEALSILGPHGITLAKSEGLAAHALSISKRLP